MYECETSEVQYFICNRIHSVQIKYKRKKVQTRSPLAPGCSPEYRLIGQILSVNIF